MFGLQVGWTTSWHAWRHVDAGLSLIPLGMLVTLALLAFCIGESAGTVTPEYARNVAR